MTAEQYLKRLKDIDDLIAILYEELEKTEAMAKACGTQLNAAPSFSSDISDKTASLAMRIAELNAQLTAQKTEYINIKLTALRLIKQIPDLRYQTVLYEYYYHNRTLEGTAGHMHRTYQNVCELKKQALNKFQTIMERENIC